MKEAERQKLQDTLHKEVMRKIVLLQSWLRVVLERRRFLRMRQAAIVLQVPLGVTQLLLLTNQLPLSNHTPCLQYHSLTWALSSLRPAGVPGALGWRCRGAVLPCASRQPGEGTGRENATSSRRGEFVFCKPCSEAICNVRGKGGAAV